MNKKKGKPVGENEKTARKSVLEDLSKQLQSSIMKDIKKPKAEPKADDDAMEEGPEAEEMTVGDYNPGKEPTFSTEEDIDAQINKLLEAKKNLKTAKSSESED